MNKTISWNPHVKASMDIKPDWVTPILVGMIPIGVIFVAIVFRLTG